MTETKKLNRLKCLDSTALKVIAMFCMLLDHMEGALFMRQDWMGYVGRIAFPIFAFQIAEGYNHTRDFKTYLKRMFLFALISEIPFNMMHGGFIYPFSQNVMFTFCISLLVIRLIDKSWQKNKVLGVVAAVCGTLVGYFAGFALFVDYMGFGVLMTVAFWISSRIPYGWILKIVSIIYINGFMIKGLNLTFMWNGETVWFPTQAFAILSLIPIFLYNGKKGPGGKKFQYGVYLFYPVHMLILGIIAFMIM